VNRIAMSALRVSATMIVLLAGVATARAETIVLDCSTNVATDYLMLDLTAKSVSEELRWSTPAPGGYDAKGPITQITDGQVSWTFPSHTMTDGSVVNQTMVEMLNRYTGILNYSWTTPAPGGSNSQTCHKRQRQF
jgi:hypothetical protein